jgi:hypothetical protein
MNMGPFTNKCFCSDGVGLDRFFSRKNVALYRALADKGTNAATRRRILRSLREEEFKFKLEFKKPPSELNDP